MFDRDNLSFGRSVLSGILAQISHRGKERQLHMHGKRLMIIDAPMHNNMNEEFGCIANERGRRRPQCGLPFFDIVFDR